jgi:hypothetical protein
MRQPTPELFVDTVFAYQKTAAIKAAICVRLFTAIGTDAKTIEAIAKETGASPKGIRVLCDYLTVQGFLKKLGDCYEATAETQMFLDAKSPAYMGGVVDFMASPEMMRSFLEDPTSYVRNGGAIGSSTLDPNDPTWVTFARAMVPFMAPLAQSVAEQVAGWSPPPRKVLDIAAGHGMFGGYRQAYTSGGNCCCRLGASACCCKGECEEGWDRQSVSNYCGKCIRGEFRVRLRSRASAEFPAPL